MDCSMPGFPVLYYLPELAQTQVHWVAVAIKPSNFLSPPSSPAFSLHSIVVFSNESALPIRWPKYWGFSFSINPSNEYSGLISFSIDWFDFLAVWETLKSFRQHYNSKASILRFSVFFMVQLSHPYWKNPGFDYTGFVWQSDVQFSSVQLFSCVRLFASPWTAAHQSSLSNTNSWSLLKLMSIPSIMLSNHLILCRLLLLSPSVFPMIRVSSNELLLRIRWPKYWSFSFSISPSNEYSGLISFRMDWLDLLAVQRTLKSFLQHHSSKASIFWCSAFFIVQLSHPYMTPGKTIALTSWNFVGKIMSLLFNMLSSWS